MNEYKMYYNVSITADAAKVHTGRPRLVRELCPNKHFETIFTLCSLQLVRFLKRSHSKLLNSAILISFFGHNSQEFWIIFTTALFQDMH